MKKTFGFSMIAAALLMAACSTTPSKDDASKFPSDSAADTSSAATQSVDAPAADPAPAPVAEQPAAPAPEMPAAPSSLGASSSGRGH